MEAGELNVQDKKEAEAQGELTRPGDFFTPVADIFEDRDSVILVADMPGVNKDGVTIQVEDNKLSIQGEVGTERPGRPIFSEYPIGGFMRTFTLAEIIDQSKIEASIKDGVLRVALPKAEAGKPRKISVKAE
ncbi:Hsp20/alpha crystallin family protein [Desulfonema magnum]|uniref:Heat shock protein, Hsp 20 family n=1 Tax=Desulfonema magnum TaxID=45655 RepID=A0A975BR32_9BACT|nr:Hsp20/alpha crystallin family protein [Desulfonema magnum]QTA90157.1 Heat shock protein, Hsp 20 family [Desulfonema magnum]